MNIKQKDIIDRTGYFPENATTIADNPDYLSCQRMTFNEAITPQEAYVKMTSSQPKWLGLLFTVRDVILRFAGVKPNKGFGKIESKEYEVN